MFVLFQKRCWFYHTISMFQAHSLDSKRIYTLENRKPFIVLFVELLKKLLKKYSLNFKSIFNIFFLASFASSFSTYVFSNYFISLNHISLSLIIKRKRFSIFLESIFQRFFWEKKLFWTVQFVLLEIFVFARILIFNAPKHLQPADCLQKEKFFEKLMKKNFQFRSLEFFKNC